MRLSIKLLPLALAGLFAVQIAASGQQRSDVAPLIIRKTDNFDINGKGTSEKWNLTDWVVLEKRKGPADFRTRAKLLYSETGLYVLMSNEDKKITATFTEDFANLWTEDVVEIFLWTSETEPLYFEYELSPLNYELPILVPNTDGAFFGWKPWQYEGERKTRHATHMVKDDEGQLREWIAEFFIPFALLRPLRNVPPTSGTEWRMNLYRIDYDDEYSSWTWMPVRTTFHDYKSFGSIRFE